jgi:MFS transporter, DHA2 family, multidrug resistance protein
MQASDKGDEEPLISQPIPWGILLLNFLATLALAFPFYTSYVALPQMMVSMSANLDEIQWVLTAYAIAQTVMMPMVGWRTIFLIGLPLGVVSIGVAWGALPPSKTVTQGRLDSWGFMTMGLFLVPLLFGLCQGRYQGWDDPLIRVSFAVAAVSGGAFIIVEMRRAAPLLDLRLFRIFPFAMACVVRFLNHISFNAYSLLVALFRQETLDYTPLQAGLAVLPAALAVGPAGLTVGRLSDRMDPRMIFLLGLLMMTLGVYLFSSVNAWTPVVWVMTLVVILRVGSECVFSPLNNASLRLLPTEWVRMGSGLLGLMWGVGGSVGNALTVALLDTRQAVHATAAGQDHYGSSREKLYALNEIQHSLQRAGAGADRLGLQAQDLLEQHLTQETAVAAFQDCFLLTAIVFILAMVPALFIRPQRRQVWRKGA